MHIDANLSHVLLQEQEYLSSHVQRAPSALITPAPTEQDLARIEQTQRLAPKDIVQFQGIEIDLETTPKDTDQEFYDIQNLTPREMVDVSLELYVEGDLSYDDYSLLAYQSELHPDFEDTIGALTGERADPDRPRNYIAEWEDRYNFERRYPSGDPKDLQQIERILGVLNSLTAPTDFVA